jgi:hemoglobin
MLLTAAILLSLSSCARTTATPGGKSLYVRLGGTTMIASVVEEFLTNATVDNRINGRFATADLAKLRGHLLDQFCMMTGGPCVYRGRDMKSTHAGMKITSLEFDALVEDLVRALDRFKLPAREKGELLHLLGPMKKEIVE